MIRLLTMATVVLALTAGAAYAADPIPPHLVGIWVKDGAVLRGQLLYEGEAMYLGADGVGAIIGGPPPIGFEIVATFNAEKNTIEIDAYDGKKKGPHGAYVYDPKSNTIDSGPPKHQLLRRRYENFSNETRRALGITAEALKQRLLDVGGRSAEPTESPAIGTVIAAAQKTVAPQHAPTPVRNSNPPRIENLAIKPGDSLESVRAATHNSLERNFDGKNWYLEPFGDGTYVYFDASDRVEIIRLLSGAQTTIGGLPVRGSFSRILARLGPPDVTEALPGGQTEAEIYYLDDDTAVIFYKSEPSGFIGETRIVSNKSHPPRSKWPDLLVEQ